MEREEFNKRQARVQVRRNDKTRERAHTFSHKIKRLYPELSSYRTLMSAYVIDGRCSLPVSRRKYSRHFEKLIA